MSRNFTMKPNTWTYVKGYEERYGINIYGNVWSYPDPSKPGAKGKQLAVSEHKNGYAYVTLYKEGKPQRHYIHKLVAEAFKANPNNFKCIRHLDGNKKNNHVVNLEWVNNSILQRKPKAKELPPTLCKSFGGKLKELHGREIREMKREGMNVAQIMKKFSASRYQVEACLYGTESELKELEWWRELQEVYGKEEFPDYLFKHLLEYLPREVNSWVWKRQQAQLEESWREEYGEDWKAKLKEKSEAGEKNLESILAKASGQIRQEYNLPPDCDVKAWFDARRPENWDIEKMAAEYEATGKITSFHGKHQKPDDAT